MAQDMEVVLKKMGISTVLVMPPSVLKELKLGAGHRLAVEITADGSVLLTPSRNFVLADLLTQCDSKVAPPADLTLWDAAKPAGQDAW